MIGAAYCRVTDDTAESYRESLPDPAVVSAMGELFRVLGNPTRLQILAILQKEPVCVSCLCAILKMEQSAVSQQLKILRQTRLVRYHREGKLAIYSLADEHVRQLVGTALEHVEEMYP